MHNIILTIAILGLITQGHGMRRGNKDECIRTPNQHTLVVNDDDSDASNCIECGRGTRIVTGRLSVGCYVDGSCQEFSFGGAKLSAVTAGTTSLFIDECCGERRCDLDQLLEPIPDNDNNRICPQGPICITLNATCVGPDLGREGRENLMSQCFGYDDPLVLFPVLPTTALATPTAKKDTTTTTHATTTSPVPQTTSTQIMLSTHMPSATSQRAIQTTSTSAVSQDNFTTGSVIVSHTAQTTSPVFSNAFEEDFSGIPAWIPIVVILVVLAFLLLLFILVWRRNEIKKYWSKSKLENENTTWNKSSIKGDQEPDVASGAPSKYEEINPCKQVVNNVLYESQEVSANSNYDHLWKNKSNLSPDYNRIKPNTNKQNSTREKEIKVNQLHIPSDDIGDNSKSKEWQL